jgi:hypothetical protein
MFPTYSVQEPAAKHLKVDIVAAAMMITTLYEKND